MNYITINPTAAKIRAHANFGRLGLFIRRYTARTLFTTVCAKQSVMYLQYTMQTINVMFQSAV